MCAGRRWLTNSSRSGGTSCPASALLQLKGGSRSWSRLSRPAHPPSRPRGSGKRGGERGRGVPLTTLLDFLAGFTGDYAPRVMFPSGVARPKMLRILAGMDQKDCCSGICKAGFPGVAPRAVLWGMARLFGRISHYSKCSTRCTPSTSCVCHPSVVLVCVWIWQTQSRAGSTVGRSCSQLQLRSPPWCRSQSLW